MGCVGIYGVENDEWVEQDGWDKVRGCEGGGHFGGVVWYTTVGVRRFRAGVGQFLR